MNDTVSKHGKEFRHDCKKFAAFTLLAFSLVSLCFCTLFPAALFLSFLFNGIWLGSSLFSALAQEREKRTIDALRLTQLTSLDILMLKSRRELRAWALGNVALLGVMMVTGHVGQESMLWVFSGWLALATGGLLSIALALAVSTRSETTSSAVVTGWVSKGVWLAGLPLLDQVLEAVFVLKGPLHFLRFLDPAWVAYRVGEASFFELSSLTVSALWMGAAASVVVALVMVVQSSRIIDSSFEAAGCLEDRERHRVYRQKYAGGLDKNPFFLRELAWQLRSGAGRWPGYAVFLTLFLAPFMYGVAQQQKVDQPKPVRIVRQDVVQRPSVAPTQHQTQQQVNHNGTPQQCHIPVIEVKARPHSHLCLSRAIGLPVDRHSWLQPSETTRMVMTENGQVQKVSDRTLQRMSESQQRRVTKTHYRSNTKSFFQRELGRGLLTGLLLTVIYLFVRGGAFMAGAVTGERERRAWDQIALTGATPDQFLLGKLAGVLAFPVRQLLFCSPVLILFAVNGVISFGQLILVVGMLLSCFAAAGTLGLMASASRPTSHQAQGFALAASAALLVLPMSQYGWVALAVGAVLLASRTEMETGARFATYAGVMGMGFVGGSAASPLAAVMALCGSSVPMYGPIAGAGATAMLAWSGVWMAMLAYGFYKVAVLRLESGGSVAA